MHARTFQLLLALREAPSQAGDILDRMHRLGGSRPSIAAFYRLLKSAIDAGWVEIVGSDPGGPGRPRQIYAVTGRGAAAIATEGRRMQALVSLALDADG